MERTPLTPYGHKLLVEELKRLKSIKRPQIIKAIEEARQHGDLKENAEYHAAKEQQSFNEGRIREIENKVASSQIIDVAKIAASNRVIFGTTVELQNLTTQQKCIYTIVGEDEADLDTKLSVYSPIARSIIGKEAGDKVTVNTPTNKIEFEITKVDYI